MNTTGLHLSGRGPDCAFMRGAQRQEARMESSVLFPDGAMHQHRTSLIELLLRRLLELGCCGAHVVVDVGRERLEVLVEVFDQTPRQRIEA